MTVDTARQANVRFTIWGGFSALLGLVVVTAAGCGVADDDLAAVLAGFGRTDVPILEADVPRDQGEQIPDVGQDPGGDPGQDPGVPVCPAAKDCTGRACGPDPVCGMSCGTCVAWATCNTSGQCIDEGGCGANCGAMVTVPAGSFMQGCNEAVDTECGSNEKPYHQVTVPAFEIDKYEVTVVEYEVFVEALGGSVGTSCDGGTCTPRDTTYSSWCNWGVSGKAEHPVNCITWYQAREYCAWAGKRLCSESEWEKASRGTDGRKYPWGNETATCEYAVMYEGGYGCGTNSTWPVGSKPLGTSPYGALDLSGNVWEWVEDDWHSTYTGAPTNGSAWVDEPRASVRVRRGGSFGNDFADDLRSSYRLAGDPAVDFGYVSFGARCCRSK